VGWWHSLLSEVFPSWHERRLLRRLQVDNEASRDALQRLRRKIAIQSKYEKRNAMGDPREQPSSNLDGERVGPPPVKETTARERVPASPQQAKGTADRGAL
jgi:hypothetical protein